MNTVKSLLTAAALTAAALPASAQLVAELGDVTLQPNQSGQIVDIFVENLSSSPVLGIDAFNFVLQVNDALSGPKIQSVDLLTGTSVFNTGNFTQAGPIGGSTDWIAGFNLDSDGHHPTTIPGNSLTLLARVTFDTTGILASMGPLPLSVADTLYTLNALSGNSTTVVFSSTTGGTITVVPEPQQYAMAAGLGLLALAFARRFRFA